MSNLAINDLVGDGIKALLMASGDLRSLVNNRIFDEIAEPGTSYPLVLYGFTTGGYTNSSPRPDVSVLCSVECIATDREKASRCASAIYACLAGKQITIPGFNNYWIAHDRFIAAKRYVDAQVYFTRGGFYEFRADQRT